LGSPEYEKKKGKMCTHAFQKEHKGVGGFWVLNKNDQKETGGGKRGLGGGGETPQNQKAGKADATGREKGEKVGTPLKI